MGRLIILLLLATSAAFPWGLRGHRIVAQIAQNHLNSEALKKVKVLLDQEPLSRIANEVDGYRADAKWKCASPFHYVSVEDGETYTKSQINPQGDVVSALLYFESVLRDKDANVRQKVNAIKWLVHLVGDIHQPLHVGRACDRGGNSVTANWFSTETNLHKIWDSQLINYEELSFSEYAGYLDNAVSKKIDRWSNSTYLDWAKEAQDLRVQVYTCWGRDDCCANPKRGCKAETTVFGACGDETPDIQPILGYTYIEKNREMLNEQLLKAGIRLAAVLNRIYSDTPLTAEELKLREKIKALKPDATVAVQGCIDAALK